MVITEMCELRWLREARDTDLCQEHRSGAGVQALDHNDIVDMFTLMDGIFRKSKEESISIWKQS